MWRVVAKGSLVLLPVDTLLTVLQTELLPHRLVLGSHLSLFFVYNILHHLVGASLSAKFGVRHHPSRVGLRSYELFS